MHFPAPLKDQEKIKQKILRWAARFDAACVLDSNNYKSYKYSDFEFLAAAGAKEIFAPAKNYFSQLKNFAAPGQWCFGFLTYDLKNELEDLSSSGSDGIQMPDMHFFTPEHLFILKKNSGQIEIISDDPQKIWKEMQEQEEISAAAPPIAVHKRIPKAEYLEKIHAIKDHIRKGDIYEMNFCQEFFAENAAIDPIDKFIALNKISKAPFAAFYKLRDKYLLCESPERFLKKIGSKLISQPIKGTIKRGKTGKEDEQLRQELYLSAKDRSENVMIVDLVRNDLSKSAVAGTVEVEELFGIYSFMQVHQMISTISCTLSEDIHFIDAVKNAFPMGSMTGAPKVRAMELIETYEQAKRGLFSGAAGYITPEGDFDFNVVIRSILYNAGNKYLSFQTGGAITISSVPDQEYEESLLKAKAMQNIL